MSPLAQDELRANLCLEIANLRAQGRLRDVQRLRRARET
jgi:hypothetical protein